MHVYQAGKRRGALQRTSEYGSDTQTEEAPILVMFYGQHYDALLDASTKAPLRSEL